MRAVLDTNVVVLGVLQPASKPGIVLDMALSGGFDLVASEYLLAEYIAVLRRPKFSFDSSLCVALVDALRMQSNIISAFPQGKFVSPDPKDQPVLDLAVTAGSLLVSGNTRHFSSYPKLVSPAGFLDLCRGAEHVL